MKKKILYLDDEPDQIFTLKQLLSNIEELEIIGATTYKECCSILDSDESLPDLILLDLMMNDVSGWEVFDDIRSNPSWSQIPIIFLTARTDDFAIEAGLKLSEGYIEKPFNKTQIISYINKVLNININQIKSMS